MTLEEQLLRDEGEVLHVYPDSLGIRTGGVGHNLEAHKIPWPIGTPITKEQSRAWLAHDIEETKRELAEALPWTQKLDPVRLGVLQNMWFNMEHKLLGFHHMLKFAEEGNYMATAAAMAGSLWAKEVGIRSIRLEQQMVKGVWI